jgi:hypothetical protein
MPSVTISDEVFERLTRRAAALNVTVEQLIAPLLSIAVENHGSGDAATALSDASFDNWKKKFDAWMVDVQGRAHRYPPGFVMDDSRESIYQGCGE